MPWAHALSRVIVGTVVKPKPGLIRLPHDTQFLHPTPQRTRLKVEKFCRASLTLDPPARFSEHSDDVLALDFFERREAACDWRTRR